MGNHGPRSTGQSDSWFRPELKADSYDIFGDAYDDDRKYNDHAGQWAIDLETFPYLAWVKRLSESGRTHLRLLADFMSIGAVPQRWDNINPDPRPLSCAEISDRIDDRRRRVEKTNVCILDYHTNVVNETKITSAQDLREELKIGVPDGRVQFRLYVVEDLSRDVIEALGQKLHNLIMRFTKTVTDPPYTTVRIEPDFFRAHIMDFAWYNVRDRWRDPPLLDIVSHRQNWMQLRYVTARYFDANEKEKDNVDFQHAAKEAFSFNILRRVDDDLSNKSVWDKPKAIVGLTRSRATFWLQPKDTRQSTPVGVLLLDPTVTKGIPLWRGRRTLWSTPAYGETDPEPSLQQDNFFKDFIFWARQQDLYPNPNTDHASKPLVPLQVLLHLVCSEWLTMLDYIKTRLGQLDWEIVKPEFFRLGNQGDALEKLHVWRRLVPLYREMVSETIRHIDQFSCRIQAPIATRESGHIGSDMVLGSSPVETSHSPTKEPLDKTRIGVTTSFAHPLSPGNYVSDQAQLSLISHYQRDFSLIQSQLEEYQKRIDQLTAVVTAAISIEDSRRGLQNNHNIGRLTWLATLFIPLSIIAGVLSMQSNVGDISGKTFVVYFATSIPLAAVVAVAAFTLSLSRSQTKSRLRNLVNLKGMVRDFWAQ
ncbi:hypothetical protein HD806DRAFT_19871 [Xylariaceae sp. AK1471]|nr:hypothetical protein HD806DRAFT_19871 [Xylariaceae sp. AK1471]